MIVSKHVIMDVCTLFDGSADTCSKTKHLETPTNSKDSDNPKRSNESITMDDNKQYGLHERNICVLIPGFIKSYNHISYLRSVISKIKSDNVNVFVFGHIFRFMIKPNVNKEKINYSGKDFIDTNQLDIFTSYSFVPDDYSAYDSEGYDNRIYSQWHNIQKSFDLYKEFSEQHNVTCDVFVRLRSDIRIGDIDTLNLYIHKAIDEQCMIFSRNGSGLLEDQIFMGAFKLFQKLIALPKYMKEYYELPEVKQKIEKHQNNKDRPAHNRYLRFESESERLMEIHVKKFFTPDDYQIVSQFHSLNRNDT